jgi:hypothetical protein
MLAMYSSVGTGKFSAIECRQATRLRGDALNCQRLLKPLDALEVGRGNADEIVRGENLFAAGFQSAIRQLVTALSSQTKTRDRHYIYRGLFCNLFRASRWSNTRM